MYVCVCVEEINKEARDITAKMRTSDKVQMLCEKHAFLTVKYNKNNFYSYLSFCLINPTSRYKP